MIVFHGSISVFDDIEPTRGKPYKDFGLGFYVTKNLMHAKTLALRNKRNEFVRGNKAVKAYLYTYEMNVEDCKKFNTKIFFSPDLEWVSNKKSASILTPLKGAIEIE